MKLLKLLNSNAYTINFHFSADAINLLVAVDTKEIPMTRLMVGFMLFFYKAHFAWFRM